MIIKLTLVGLIIVLVAVIALSYYNNKECFEDITNQFNASCTDSCESGIQSKDGSAILTMPDRTDITPDNQMSDMGSMTMALKYKSDLLKDLKKVVRNELIANRMTKRLKRDDSDNSEDNSDANSDAMAQGREYGCHRQDTYRCPKNPDGSCPPVPDMSDFIMKDSIPCFGCSLDY